MNTNQRRLIRILTCIGVAVLPLPQLEAQNIEAELKRVAQNANFAVISIWYNTSDNMQVVGTGFLVTPDGSADANLSSRHGAKVITFQTLANRLPRVSLPPLQ
jgi:hypothetical protein